MNIYTFIHAHGDLLRKQNYRFSSGGYAALSAEAAYIYCS